MTDTTIDNGAPENSRPQDGGNGGATSSTTTASERPMDAATLKDSAAKYGTQAADKARAFADMGKDRATDALGQLSQLLTDAAGQVDEKLGAQYGDYARTAAGQVSTFADQLKAKDVDAIVDEARGYIRKSPGVAIGIAATLGFVLARVVQAGIDADTGSGKV